MLNKDHNEQINLILTFLPVISKVKPIDCNDYMRQLVATDTNNWENHYLYQLSDMMFEN